MVKPYVKSDSFISVLGAVGGSDEVLKKILGLSESLRKGLVLDDSRDAIASLACDQILSKDPNPLFWLRETARDEFLRLKSKNEMVRYLYFRYRYEVYPRTKILDDFPPLLQIEPTSICNLRCVFCYQTDKTFTDPKNGHMGMMDIDVFKKVVDEAVGRTEGVTLASRGEPLAHKKIIEMLDYLGGKFLALKVNTNATFLTEEASHAILSSGVQTLVISADAADPVLYSKLRVRGNLERVLSNVRRFKEIRDEQYPESRTLLRVSGVKFSEEQDLASMQDGWGDIVDQVAFVEYNPWENTYEQPENTIVTPCSEYWRRTFVLWDGRVNPCDTDYKGTLSVGNISDDTVSNLWQGEKYQTLREKHLARRRSDIFPCNRCTVV